MLVARYRDACWKDVPAGGRSIWRLLAPIPVMIGFVGFLGIVIGHRIYLGNDSAQSYGHVWFIADSLFSGHGIPLHIPNLALGRAFTFPYAVIPWLPTALVWPILGDWAVTVSLVLGVVLLIVGVARWLPRTTSPLVLGMTLVNWQLWNSVLQFQLPTIWALALAALAAAEFDRSRPLRGATLATAALFAHPLMGATGLALTLLARVESTHRVPFGRAVWLIGAVLIALPAIWTFVHLPSIGQVPLWRWATPTQILLQRSSMLWWPWVAQRVLALTWRVYAPLMLILTLLLVRNFAGSNPQNARWQSLPRFADFMAAGRLDPAARYRVLTMSNQEDGMVQLLQAGAVLAQDFFDESIQRVSFGNVDAYRCFLESRGANHVLVNAEWIRRGRTDEVQLLDTLAQQGRAELVYRGPAGTLDYAIAPLAPGACGAPR
ncbi:MAG: hypothetical protein WCQ48_02430 [Chloroflexota bacterium]